MKLLKKILAMLLVANILISTVITTAATEMTDTSENDGSAVTEMMSLGGKSPLDGSETPPFNSADGAPLLMSKENELLLYTSGKEDEDEDDDFISVFEKMDMNTSYATEGRINPSLDLFFVTAVALNATGNGTDDHIAYLGVKAFDKNDGANAGRAGEQVLMLVLYNARKERVVDTVELGSVKSWINNVEHWSYKTLFSITAGDYDGDGIDEIACTDADMGVQMLEIDTSEDEPKIWGARRYYWTELVTPEVAEKMKKSVTSSAEVYRRVCISLTTGNLDGTGAEELATAVSTNNPGDSKLLPDIPEAYTTQVAAIFSPLGSTASIRTLVIELLESSSDEEERDNVVHRVIYVGQISAGDVDGDRRDEIVVAGYTGRIEVTAKGNFVDGRYEYDESNIALCYADVDGYWFGIPEFTVDAMTPFIEEGFFDDNELLVPLSLDTAKLHGQYGKESVFVGGKVYHFTGEGAEALYTHSLFQFESSFTITDAYVEHVTSGVFGGVDVYTDKPMVNEQFVFTVVEKDSGQNDYSYMVGFISMSTDPTTETTTFMDNYYVMESDDYLLDECPGGISIGDTNYGTALVPIAADIDDDGLLVKHTNTDYFYEDPAVEAILQAAPYFDELGDWNEFNSSTTYSVSVSRSLIDIWGYTHSIHVGFKGKVEFEGVSEIELKVGYALDMDFEHEKSYTTAYTTTFEAGSFDTVIVQRTPYVCYEYSFVDLEGNLLTGEDAGSLTYMEALHPVYFQLSVEEYNQFVDQYNALADKHDSEGVTEDGEPVEAIGDSYRLVKITDDILPSNATGNPENCFTSLRDGEYISQGTYALGHNGGYTSSEFSYEIEESYSAVYAHGLHFELEGVGGGNMYGAGAFAALSFQETCGYGEATVNGTGTGGTVANIIPSNYADVEQEALKMYGFNWRCAMWKKSLMTDVYGNPYRDSEGNLMQIPVVGYVVSNVKRPMAAPTRVEAFLTGDGRRVTVDWAPFSEDTENLLGYYVYRTCDNQTPVTVNATILPASTTSFVDTSELRPGKIYTYYVAASYNNGDSTYMTMNSTSSSVVWGVPIQTEQPSSEVPDGSELVASIFGDGSFVTIAVLIALGVAAAVIGIVLTHKKKKLSESTSETTESPEESSESKEESFESKEESSDGEATEE